ncbi:hypothetical protein BCT86_10085 [Vibrio breoganii]|uniref:DUF2955 domain-containing protein n=1 Tax=Vibrio breoganii TaxID=553239 RepID=UPI000C825017|nr:DUF2955 domain-containing protein [Vibrio breoganii]PML07218.1 hypothetical protein BCT86_10085 [Vibrio breoganii]
MFDNITKAQERKIFRFIFGVGLSTFIAVWFNWPLAFCAPLLTAKFIVDKAEFHILHVKQLVYALVVTMLISYALSTGFPEYKIAFLALYGAGILWAYYLFTDPKWVMFATFLVINLLLQPYITIVDQQAALDVGIGFAFSGVVSVGFYALSHVYFPEIEENKFNGFPPSPLPQAMRWGGAIRAWLISFPLICLYFYYQLSQVMLTVAFVTLLSLFTTGEKANKTSMFFIIANVFGAILALIGTKIYTDPAKAPIYATAFTGFLVLIGSSMTTGALDDKLYVRIFQLILVIPYLVFMVYFFEGRDEARKALVAKTERTLKKSKRELSKRT